MFSALYLGALFFYSKLYWIDKKKNEHIWAVIVAVGTFVIFTVSSSWLVVIGLSPRRPASRMLETAETDPSIIYDPKLPLETADAFLLAAIVGIFFFLVLKSTRLGAQSKVVQGLLALVSFAMVVIFIRWFTAFLD